MITGQFLTALLSSISLINASVQSLDDLQLRMEQVSLKDVNLITTRQDEWHILKVIEQGELLRASTLNDDIQVVVKKIDAKLLELFELGISPLDAISIINSFFLDVEELVLTAIAVQAHTLLRLLQMIYIWRDEAQFHWFQALCYNSPWYDEQLWMNPEPFPMNWKRNLRAICKCDNDALLAVIRQRIPRGDGLIRFNEKLLALCAEYDAMKIFKFAKFAPIQLEDHLGLLSINSAVNLLRLYQSACSLQHLHLERFPPPKKTATNINDFKFLMSHGHDCFPMNKFIRKFCKEGRLDLLKYLHSLNGRLTPSPQDLDYAVRMGWIDILKWVHQLTPIDRRYANRFVVSLAVHRHFKALDLWLNENDTSIGKWDIRKIVEAGVLEPLIWIYERQSISQGDQEWVNSAAKNCHLSVLKWLYEKFKLFPSEQSLEKSGIEMIKRLRAIVSAMDNSAMPNSIMSNRNLAQYAADNLAFLQWIVENAPPPILASDKGILSKNTFSKKAMKWLYRKLKICPSSMNWAYEIGDLKAIKWALNNCQISSSPENTKIAIKRGHFHLIKWIHKKYPEHLRPFGTLVSAIESGNLKIADYLLLYFIPDKTIWIRTDNDVSADQRLNILKWTHEHGFGVRGSYELYQAAEKGDLDTIKWLTKMFPFLSFSSIIWDRLLLFGQHEAYQWFLETHPEGRQQNELRADARMAFHKGHLGIVAVILNKYPLFVKEMPSLRVDKLSYHVKRWLIVNGRWPGQSNKCS